MGRRRRGVWDATWPTPMPAAAASTPPKTRGVHARTHGRTNAINSPFGNGAKQTKSYFLLLFVILNVYFRNPNSCAPASIYPRRGHAGARAGEMFLPVPFRSLPPSDALASSSGFKGPVLYQYGRSGSSEFGRLLLCHVVPYRTRPRLPSRGPRRRGGGRRGGGRHSGEMCATPCRV